MRTTKALSSFTFILLGSLYLFYLYFYPLSFNYEIETNQHYYFYNVSLLVLLLVGYFLFSYKCINNHSLLTLVASVLIIVTCYNLSPDNEHGSNLISFSIFFILLQVIKIEKDFIFVLFSFFTFGFLSELGVGLFQLISSGSNYINTIQGTFTNSGIYSCYLVINYPIITYYIRGKIHPRFSLPVNSLIALISILLIAFAQSRSAWMASIVFLCLTNSSIIRKYYKKVTYARAYILTICGCIVALLIIYIYQFKILSSLGRLLIWKVTFTHFFDQFILGLGIGNFSYYYPIWQANYFSFNKTYDNFFLAAGETYNAFNEYLTYFKELGLIRFGFVVLILSRFFILKNKTDSDFYNSVKYTVIIALICSLTTYTFHSTAVLFLVFCLVSIAFTMYRSDENLDTKKISKKFRILFFVSFLLTSSILLFRSTKNSIYIYSWVNFRKEQRQIDIAKQRMIYDALFYHLYFDSKFLYNYAEFSFNNNDNKATSIQLLKLANKRSQSPKIYYLMGHAYLEARNYSGAIDSFLFLSNLVPSKFEYKYQLMRSYYLAGNSVFASAVAKEILKMPVKVPSTEVDDIKNKVLEMQK